MSPTNEIPPLRDVYSTRSLQYDKQQLDQIQPHGHRPRHRSRRRGTHRAKLAVRALLSPVEYYYFFYLFSYSPLCIQPDYHRVVSQKKGNVHAGLTWHHSLTIIVNRQDHQALLRTRKTPSERLQKLDAVSPTRTLEQWFTATKGALGLSEAVDSHFVWWVSLPTLETGLNRPELTRS